MILVAEVLVEELSVRLVGDRSCNGVDACTATIASIVVGHDACNSDKACINCAENVPDGYDDCVEKGGGYVNPDSGSSLLVLPVLSIAMVIGVSLNSVLMMMCRC